jgi:hypothetical protein
MSGLLLWLTIRILLTLSWSIRKMSNIQKNIELCLRLAVSYISVRNTPQQQLVLERIDSTAHVESSGSRADILSVRRF